MNEFGRALIRGIFPSEEKQWVNWRYQERNGAETKVPLTPTGGVASSTDPATWSTLEEVLASEGSDGIGIVFTGSLLGVDFDHCIDGSGNLSVEVATFIEKANTYTEVSPSGKGLHAYFRLTEPLELAAMRSPRGNGRDYECYTTGRYFTVSGNPWGMVMPLRIVSAEEAVDLLHLIGYPWKKLESQVVVPEQAKTYEREKELILKRMFAARNGDKIRALYDGDTSEYGGDTSRADAALCSHIAFYTDDPSQVEDLWLMSPLGAREKTQNRPDYRKRTIENALELTPKPEKSHSHVSRTSASSGKAILTSFAHINPKPIEWLWRGRIAVGKLTLIAGDPGLGKSMATVSMAAMVSTGAPWPAGEGTAPVGDVIMLSAEDDPADTIRPRLDAAGVDPTRVFVLESVLKTNSDGSQSSRTFSLKEDLETLREALASLPNPKLVIIDPISAYLGDADSHKNADVRGVLAPLSRLASEYGVAVVAVSHLNKNSENKNALHRVMGSLAFTAAARACFAVVRDKEDPERRLFLPIKNNIAKDFTGLAYKVVDTESEAGLAEWEDQVVIVPKDEMLDGPSGAEELTNTEWAVHILEGELAGGPKLFSEVAKTAEQHKVKTRAFTSARERLGVLAKKSRTANGPWFMALPEDAQLLEDIVSGKVSANSVAKIESEEESGETADQ